MRFSNFSINGELLHFTEQNQNSVAAHKYIYESHALASYAACLNVVINSVSKELGIKVYDMQIHIHANTHQRKKQNDFDSLDVHIDLVTHAPAEHIVFLMKYVKQRCAANRYFNSKTSLNYKLNTSAYKEELYAKVY